MEVGRGPAPNAVLCTQGEHPSREGFAAGMSEKLERGLSQGGNLGGGGKISPQKEW